LATIEKGDYRVRITSMPDKAIPIHCNDYDVFKSPLEDFKAAAEEAGLTEKMIYLAHGDAYDFQISADKNSKEKTNERTMMSRHE